MLDPVASVPDGLSARSALAYSVRLAWRALPLLDAEPVERYAYACLAMAEAVAGGESVHPLQATVTLQRMEEGGRAASDLSPRAARASSAAWFATLGGIHVHRALEELGGVAPNAAKAQDDNFQLAQRSMYEAMNAGMEALGLWKTNWNVPYEDRRLASRALSADQGRLYQPVRRDPLGKPMWPAEQGQLGALWPGGLTPTWTRETDPGSMPHRRAAIVPGAELAMRDQETTTPTIAFWSLHEDGLGLEEVRRQIVAISTLHADKSAPEPVYVVHAPYINPDWVHDFMAVGATVLRDIPAEHWYDGDGGGFKAWLTSTLEAPKSVTNEGTASWKRAEARMNWRNPAYLTRGSNPDMEVHVVDTVSGSRADAPVETAYSEEVDPYAAFAARSARSMRDRLIAEKGWPGER